MDYWLNNGADCKEPQTWEPQNQNVCASNFVPLWIDVFNSNTLLVEKVTRSLQSSSLLCAAEIKLLIYMGKYDITCDWFSNFKRFNAMQQSGQKETFTIGYVVIQSKFPTKDAEGWLAKEPVQILERMMVKKIDQAFMQVLVQWASLFQRMPQGRVYLNCSKDFLILILEDKDPLKGEVLIRAKCVGFFYFY